MEGIHPTWEQALGPSSPSLLASCRGPQPFGQQGPVSWKMIFPWMVGRDEWFQDDSRALYCALYFYYCCYINSTSDHQALDSGSWGSLL